MTKSYKQVIAIDLGGTKIAAGIVDQKGRIREFRYVATDRTGGAVPVFRQIHKLIEELRKTLAGRRGIGAIGIASPGPIEKGTIVVNAPNLPGWKRVNMKRARPSALRIPLYIENDASAAALGEYRFGAGQGSKCLIYLTVSTGIGGGIVHYGKIFRGASGAAGEIGHTTVWPDGPRCGCGKRGCVEAISSGTAIARIARRPAEFVAKAARQGDRKAIKTIEVAGHYLGLAIGNAINLLNPDRVVMGGGVSQMGELLLSPVRQSAKEVTLPSLWSKVKIVRSKLGNRVGVLGAAAICFGD